MLFPLLNWIETDERMKDAEWANDTVSFIRMYQTPLVNIQRAEMGMAYLLGVQDMTPIAQLFQAPDKLNLNNKTANGVVAGNLINPDGTTAKGADQFLHREMSGVLFKSVPVMEKLRNMIIAEIKKMGLTLDVKCDDPTASVKRKDDEAIIKNWDELSAMLNYNYTAIGQTPFSLEEYEDRFGEKIGNGNVKQFKEMGFKNENPSDVKFFMDNFHKLLAEMSAGTCITSIMAQNQVEDILFENWVTDFIAKKAIACQQHVSKLNGKITYDYITPETVRIFGATGRRKDLNDSTSKAYEQRITIKELLDRVGDSFDFERDMDVLCQAIYAASNNTIDITGIGTDAKLGWYYTTGATGNTQYNYDSFMSQKVLLGYIEFISPNDTDYGDEFRKYAKEKKKVNNKDYHYEQFDNQPPNGKRYQNKAKYEVPTYCCHYLVLSAFEQKMFNFGKVPYKDIEGYNDFDANWTILTYKEIGESIAINCAMFVDLINEAWYKWRYEIRRAKPRGVAYNYDSLLAIAEETFTDTTMLRSDKLQKIITWFDGSANIVWKYPEVDGKVVPISNQQLNIEMPNGLTDGIMKWWEVLVLTWDKMLSVVGLDAPLRQGDPGNARDSMNNQFKALEYSQNNTFYIPDGITYMTQMLATRTMLYVQDIIHFNDYDTMAYKALADLVGEETLAGVAQIGKKALHRYGIFVESLNQAPQRQKLQSRLDLAVQNGKITNAEALLIDEIKSPKRQFIALAYFEQRNADMVQKNAMQMEQMKAEQAMQLLAAEKENITIKGQLDNEGKRITGEYSVQVALIQNQGGIAKQQIKETAGSRRVYEEKDAEFKFQQQAVNETGKPSNMPEYPPMIPTPSGYEQGTLNSQRPVSALKENIADSETQPTSAFA